MFTCQTAFSHRSVRYFLNHDLDGEHRVDLDQDKNYGNKDKDLSHPDTTKHAKDISSRLFNDATGIEASLQFDATKQDQLNNNPEGKKSYEEIQAKKSKLVQFMNDPANLDPKTGGLSSTALPKLEKIYNELHAATEKIHGILNGAFAKGNDVQRPDINKDENPFREDLQKMRDEGETRKRERARVLQEQGNKTVGSVNQSAGEFAKGEMDKAFSIEFP